MGLRERASSLSNALGTASRKRQTAARLLVVLGIAIAVGGACGKDATSSLADLHPTAVAVTMGELSELKVAVDFTGTGGDAKSGCPTLGSSVGATVNGQTLNVASRGGVVDCMPIAGAPCKTCAGLSFELARAWNAATPDGRIELSIADGSYQIAMTASAALFPSAIALTPPASPEVYGGDTLSLDVESRTPPLSPLHLSLITPSGPSMVTVLDLGTKTTTGGTVFVQLPNTLPFGSYQLQAKIDTVTSPQVETCEGVASCVVDPTTLVGSVELLVTN